MSKKANPTVIGVFVVVALAIATAAIVVLGSGQLFKKTKKFVAYFESSLSGLDVGAPVEFQGVRIGQVTDIKLVYDSETGSSLLPVYFEIESGQWEITGERSPSFNLDVHIERGLRAQLQSQSLVTGKLKVMLVTLPESPVRLVGGDPTVPEIPSTPTLSEHLRNSFDKLPLANIMSNLDSSMEEISTMLSSQETKDALGAMREAMVNTEEISASMRSLIEEDAPFRVELYATLEQMKEAVRALRVLTEQIEQHPESVIWGK